VSKQSEAFSKEKQVFADLTIFCGRGEPLMMFLPCLHAKASPKWPQHIRIKRGIRPASSRHQGGERAATARELQPSDTWMPFFVY
jgi:hypothetical protein